MKCMPLLTTLLFSKTGICRGIHVKFFLFLIRDIHRGCSLDPPCRGGSSVGPRGVFLVKVLKMMIFSDENFEFVQSKKILYIAWACLRYAVFSLLYMYRCILAFTQSI